VSKAFTRESDDAGGEEIPFCRPQLPAGRRNYITRDGAQRLKQRLNELLEKKQALTASGGEAAIAPDASQRQIESAVRNLQQILDSVVVAEIPADQEKIAFGAVVMIRYANGQDEAFQIVGVDEADPGRGSISWLSPLARALLSRKAGDKVRFRSPAGEEQLTILTVRYPE
jgi:transcription elongation factor GreB